MSELCNFKCSFSKIGCLSKNQKENQALTKDNASEGHSRHRSCYLREIRIISNFCFRYSKALPATLGVTKSDFSSTSAPPQSLIWHS